MNSANSLKRWPHALRLSAPGGSAAHRSDDNDTGLVTLLSVRCLILILLPTLLPVVPLALPLGPVPVGVRAVTLLGIAGSGPAQFSGKLFKAWPHADVHETAT